MSKEKAILMIMLENLQNQIQSDKYSRWPKCCQIVNKIINAFLSRFLLGMKQ